MVVFPAAWEADVVPPPIIPAAVETPTTPIFNPDLALAQSVVEAAGGAFEVHWAAGVVIVDGQRQLVVTSDRGRGWMPAAAALPADTVVPWWHDQASRWEGLLDPARVIVEYADAAGGRVIAVASTHSSAPAVAAGIPWVFAEGTEQAHPERIGGAVVTRFELQVRITRRDAARAIVDPHSQRERALWVAFDADSRAGPSPLRQAILTELQRHPGRLGDQRWVNHLDWAALESAHHDTCVAERAARVDVRDIAVGNVDTEGGQGRALLAQAYADETVLALRQPVAEHALRDAVYTWSMLLEIPPTTAPASPISPVQTPI